MPGAEARTFRFSPRDRGGVLLGLGVLQCASLGAGVLGAGTLLSAGAPLLVVLVPLVVGAAGAFASVGGEPLHELAPVAVAWAMSPTRRARWMAPVTARPVSSTSGGPLVLPPAFGQLSFACAPRPAWAGTGGPLAVVVDRRRGSATAVVPVGGRGFALAEAGEQERLVAFWGDVVGAFCAERSPVAQVAVLEWAGPAGAAALVTATGRVPASPAGAAYSELLSEAKANAARHEVLLAVTVEARRCRGRGGGAVAATLADQLRLLNGRLVEAGLDPEPPLGPTELAQALRVRLDPAAATRLEERAGALGEAGAGISVSNAGPLAMRTRWRHVAVDASLHAGYWVAEWPRLEVGPAWLEPLLLSTEAVRTVALLIEPVPPSQARRRIERDAVRLATDEEQRARGGFRIGARHRRAAEGLAEREAELVAGYPEVAFVGLVDVAAASPTELEAACASVEQAGAQAGVELRRLDGRHDLVLAATLPLGIGLGRGAMG
ncbi:MAG TPA: SCO6880 family protein [Acidimicrobiales bacterium]|nr:SCO6880 family protein [Acidimicrobiales bacterium]